MGWVCYEKQGYVIVVYVKHEQSSIQDVAHDDIMQNDGWTENPVIRECLEPV